MLQKWKLIINNWVNCYFDGTNKPKQNVNLEILLNIISHLRENLNLDESKSSVLEAQTVEEFVLEKYPSFKFENGTVEARNEDETYLVASLLLFFVCVNSKDIDIKNAMCSRLSAEDQKVILKFSKSLMECSPVTCRDVQGAITESCGLEMASLDTGSTHTTTLDATRSYMSVAETPPALRSLHSEVRRLQAALDAERFDRNYLQEELARTNSRMEKLLKDKEQHKADIMNLKAKISICCGQEDDVRGGDTQADASVKLLRQLQDTEERLVNTQEQLDDITYERDTYKAKVDELKQERDKWVSLSQQESSRSIKLAEELETEKYNVQSLREIVTELRQHNRLNGLDSSQLECDDPDTSIHSMQHNISVCSEVCANVVEVQLGEERAKIVLLKQQIQTLQDQMNELNEKTDNERTSFEKTICEKENDIFNLKHRINEEIEEKSKLNNEINELEQKLTNNNDNLRQIIEQKMQEIQTLQEEKLSLLQSLSDETTKLEKLIQDLNKEIETEKQTKLNMKEGYENHIMKLNEKVLNRNNELVELQNNIIENSEMIESLHMELRNEKDLSNKCRNEILQINDQKLEVEEHLKKKCDEINLMKQDWEQKVSAVLDELNHFKKTAKDLQDKCHVLEKTKSQLASEINKHVAKLDELEKDMENVKNTFSEEKQQLVHELNESKAIVNEEKNKLNAHFSDKISQLNNEINELEQKLKENDDDSRLKIQQSMREIQVLKEEKQSLLQSLTDENAKLEKVIQDHNAKIETEKQIKLRMKEDYENHITKLNEEISNRDKELFKLQNSIFEKSGMLESLQIALRNEKELSKKYYNEITEINKQQQDLKSQLGQKTKEMDLVQQDWKLKVASVLDESNNFKTIVSSLQAKCEILESVKSQLVSDINTRIAKYDELVENMENITKTFSQEKQKLLRDLDERMAIEIEEKSNLKVHYNEEICKLNNKIIELEAKCKDYDNRLRLMNEQKMRENQSLQEEKLSLLQSLSAETSKLEKVIQDFNTDMETEKQSKLSLKEEYENVIIKLNDEVLSKNKEIIKLQNRISERTEMIESLHVNLRNKEELSNKYRNEILQINEHKQEIEDNLKNKTEQINLMRQESEQKVATVLNELNHFKTIATGLQDKCQCLEKTNSNLASEIKTHAARFDELNKKLVNLKQTYCEETYKLTQDSDKRIVIEIEEKNNLKTQFNEEIHKLNNEIIELEHKLKDNDERLRMTIEEKMQEIQTLQDEKTSLVQILSVETTKLEKNIHDHNIEIETEKQNKLAIKDKYENKLMKLNDEVLNKNNVLKELQDNISENREIIQTLHKDLRNEKELSNKYENEIHEVNEQKQHLKEKLDEKIEAINLVHQKWEERVASVLEELNNSKTMTSNLQDECQLLLKTNSQLSSEITTRVAELDELKKEKEIIKNTFNQEKQKLVHSLDEMKTMGIEEKNNLQAKLNDEVSVLHGQIDKLEQELKDNKDRSRVTIEKYMLEIKTLQEEKVSLRKSLTNQNIKLEKMIQDHRTEIETEKLNNLSIKEGYENEIMKLNDEVLNKNNILQELQNNISKKSKILESLHINEKELSNKYENEIEEANEQKRHLEDKLDKKIEEINLVQQKWEQRLASVLEELNHSKTVASNLQDECQLLVKTNSQLSSEITTRVAEVDELKKEKEHIKIGFNEEKQKLLNDLDEMTTMGTKEKNNLQEEFNEEVGKLNNKICKLEQELNDSNDNLKLTTEKNMLEIHSLQEEKLSLLQSLSDENTKLQKVIQDHMTHIGTENETKLIVSEGYGNEIIKLHELVVNRSSELVNLQKCIFETIKVIEFLHVDLKSEKELSNKYQSETLQITKLKQELEYNLKQKNEEMALIHQDQEKNKAATNELMTELNLFKTMASNLEEKCEALENTNLQLAAEINTRVEKLVELEKEMENIKQTLSQEQQKFIHDIDERKAIETVEKSNLKAHFEDNVSKLHNEINILQQKLNDNEESSRQMIEQNVREIKTLQEEKLSLLQSLSNEKQKLEKVIKDHNAEIETEKKINLCMKQELENLNEKIFSKTKELVELQDNLFAKNEIVESLRTDLCNEKELSNKYCNEIVQINELKQDLEDRLTKKTEEINTIQEDSEKKVAAVLDGLNDFKAMASSLQEKCEFLEKINSQMTSEINARVVELDNLEINIVHMKETFSEERQKLLRDLEEKNVMVNTLQEHLQDEIHYKQQQQKILHMKNEEVAELKKQVAKMSATENRATQIIRVSAKYQAIILKRIAEIKSNTVLKELTNFGNTNSSDTELRRSLNTGSITMEDLENFLETTDRHLKKCSEKQITLQKERDRLAEVNRINESEIIDLKKFLTELSVSCQTFNNVKDLYTQKLTRVVSVQRTVRRDILNLDGRVTDACMCKLERGYAAVMQDLSECTMNLQRWVERCIGRTISPEKIKQAFMVDSERTSLAATSFQNAALEVQLEELENSFQKLLEDILRAQKGEGAKDAQAVTVMEVRAEYEDKLNRMKAKMKQLYTEQIGVFKERQREEIATLERELQKARDRLGESSRAYEEHIRGLTTELWSVGEKFLVKKEEAEWLRRKQQAGSLMSLQHVHSSGLLPPHEESARPSDTYSLRSLPVNNDQTSKKEGRGLHMSDEEGEVFDNRWLKELAATPRREVRPTGGQRLSELQWRNSLCPPHLKSSYPAETQFVPTVDEEDIKCVGVASAKPARKEVGIIAYKKPGPPTPSKQAGRLSATDSELRESLRAEAGLHAPRKTSTPSRIRALFRSNKNDTADGTPRSRRLSIFRKK